MEKYPRILGLPREAGAAEKNTETLQGDRVLTGGSGGGKSGRTGGHYGRRRDSLCSERMVSGNGM